MYRLLQKPSIYLGLQKLLGADRLRRFCLVNFAKLRSGERVLDFGCGPGYILEYLPDVDYVGVDTEPSYIEYAKDTYGDRGEFHCGIFDSGHLARFGRFDATLLFGVIHHVDDATAKELLGLLATSLKETGRVVTLDPCLVSGQSRIARFVAKSDRGRFVRTELQYRELVSPYFGKIEAEVVHNTCRIPSTEIVMLLTAPRIAETSNRIGEG